MNNYIKKTKSSILELLQAYLKRLGDRLHLSKSQEDFIIGIVALFIGILGLFFPLVPGVVLAIYGSLKVNQSAVKEKI